MPIALDEDVDSYKRTWITRISTTLTYIWVIRNPQFNLFYISQYHNNNYLKGLYKDKRQQIDNLARQYNIPCPLTLRGNHRSRDPLPGWTGHDIEVSCAIDKLSVICTKE